MLSIIDGMALDRKLKKQKKKISEARRNGSAAVDLIGIAGKVPANFDYKEELMKILEEKYLK